MRQEESMNGVYKVPLQLTAQPDGGYIVTSPLLPELLTEGDTLAEAMEHIPDALRAVVEIYEDLGKQLPLHARQDARADSVTFEYLVAAE